MSTRYVSKKVEGWSLLGTRLKASFPAGLRCIPADNLPGESYWLDELHKGADASTKAWFESYGIELEPEDVTKIEISEGETQ